MNDLHSKYDSELGITQQQLREINLEITDLYAPHANQHLPELVLLAVDPNNLYAYWNLNNNEITSHLAPAQALTLRIYSLPEYNGQMGQQTNFSCRFDINVQNRQDQQKIPLPASGRSYFAMIGCLTNEQDFETIATSNTIHIPIEKPNDQTIEAIQELTGQEKHQNLSFQQKTELQAEVETADRGGDDLTSPQVFKNFNEYGYDLLLFIASDEFGFGPELSAENRAVLLPSKQPCQSQSQFSGQGLFSATK